MIELMLDDKQGNVWDLSSIVSDIKWKTQRIGKAGSLEFTLVKGGLYENQSFSYANGDIVRFRYDGTNIFYGYIFTIDGGKSETVKITAYDQMRYLTASDTYVMAGVTAADVIKRIADDFKLRIGTLAQPSYRIPTMSEDGQALLDIIDKALTLTLHNSGVNYVFYDDFGELVLRNVEDMLVDVIIGDGSNMYDYAYKQSIDQDTYNRIKLYKDNKDTGKRDMYQVQDSATQARWGVLQLYQSVDEKLNDAQINELLATLSQLKNRETRSLKVDAIGDARIRAGCYVPLMIEKLDINQTFLIDACTHSFAGNHTMNLELKVL
jgi:hypothetical protein